MSTILPSYLKISNDIKADLAEIITDLSPDKVALLVDENTRRHCLPLISLSEVLIIEIQSGEKNKNLETCNQIWTELTTAGFTRKSLVINLGGGLIGDMGGFAAATFKRGMAFINVPTTLLSQVDASIGGKLGVDFSGLKNHIGLFQEPYKVLVNPAFLETLPPRELKSGFAEVIKHALISSPEQWEYLQSTDFQEIDWGYLIPKSIAIKNEIVTQDPREMGVRKILNYGHTIGHAIETHLLNGAHPLLHGEAIAIGMVAENKIATQMGMLAEDACTRANDLIGNYFEIPSSLPSYEQLEPYLIQDKKNGLNGLSFSLLKAEGVCTYDVQVVRSILEGILK